MQNIDLVDSGFELIEVRLQASLIDWAPKQRGVGVLDERPAFHREKAIEVDGFGAANQRGSRWAFDFIPRVQAVQTLTGLEAAHQTSEYIVTRRQ